MAILTLPDPLAGISSIPRLVYPILIASPKRTFIQLEVVPSWRVLYAGDQLEDIKYELQFSPYSVFILDERCNLDCSLELFRQDNPTGLIVYCGELKNYINVLQKAVLLGADAVMIRHMDIRDVVFLIGTSYILKKRYPEEQPSIKRYKKLLKTTGNITTWSWLRSFIFPPKDKDI